MNVIYLKGFINMLYFNGWIIFGDKEYENKEIYV